jgi:methylmalonyl-CoA mutase N-terminal domain/subunit
MQQEIAEASYRQQIEVDSNRRIIVGVNKYATAERPSIPILAMDPNGYDRQIARLKQLRLTRDNAEVEAALNGLRTACDSDENVMPHLITAAKAYATLGEITDVMREVFGVYYEPVAI